MEYLKRLYNDISVKIILSEIENIPKYRESIALQSNGDISYPFYGIANQIKIDDVERKKLSKIHKNNNWNNDWKEENWNNMVHPIFNLPYTNQIIEDFKMKRARLLRIPPRSCYEWHTDREYRIHIPLKTNDNTFFIIGKNVFNLPADNCAYWANTKIGHTFVNASSETRLHLVGMTDEYLGDI